MGQIVSELIKAIMRYVNQGSSTRNSSYNCGSKDTCQLQGDYLTTEVMIQATAAPPPPHDNNKQGYIGVTENTFK